MNIQDKISKTVAEEELVDFFARSLASLPGSASVVKGRDKNFTALLNHGLPTRRVEAWHYTDLRRLLTKIPTDMAINTDEDAKAIAPMVAGACTLSILNGMASYEFAPLPKGLSVAKFSNALKDGSADIYFDKARADSAMDNAIAQLNGSFVTDGYVINIAQNTKVEELIELQFLQTGGQSHTCLPVVFGEHSSATIIERHVCHNNAHALISSVAHLTVEKGAHARWIIVQNQGVNTTHLGQLNINLAENAKLEIYVVNAGGNLVRQEIIANVEGSHSDLILRGVNLLADDTHTDVTLKLAHNAPDTTSSETVRNVVFDQAKGVFQGQIKVAQIAQKTDAQMACNTLLLSDNADFSAKPELEIFADDVICAHGATVADIDPAHLFYLMSRGISEKSARALLIKGFVAEVVEELEDEAIVAALETVIADWLKKHG